MANRGCGCKSPTDVRVTEGGIVEQSFDGGLTWFRVADDPRFNAPVFPPLVGPIVGTMECAGAKSATEALRLVLAEFKSNNQAWESVLGLITLLIGFLSAFLPVVGQIITAFVSAVLWVVFKIGQAAFVAYDFEPDLEVVLCILFCHIQEDASFNESGWQRVKQDVTDQLSGLGETFIWNWINSLGPVGLTNSARVFPSLAGDCSQCSCGCDEPVLGAAGTLLLERPDLGVGWWQVTTQWDGSVPPGPNGDFYAEILLPACCLHNAYTYSPGLTNAPPGNRAAWNCADVPGFANYGLGGCQTKILFRAYELGIITFQILDCPP